MTVAERYEQQRGRRESYRARHLADDPVCTDQWIRWPASDMDEQIDAHGNSIYWCALHDLEFPHAGEPCVECCRAPKRPTDLAVPSFWRRMSHPITNGNTGERLTMRCDFHEWHSFTDEQACRACLDEDGIEATP